MRRPASIIFKALLPLKMAINPCTTLVSVAYGRKPANWLLGLILVIVANSMNAANPSSPPAAKLALIIDDLGNHRMAGQAALALPGPLTYSFLPHTPHAWQLATQAHASDKQVMLHLPMESDQGMALGKGGLTLQMSQAVLQHTLREALASIPYVAGINNHMGSRLTRDPTAMRWLMSALQGSHLFFVDSRTTDQTVAEMVARKNLIKTARRDVFLDNLRDAAYIRGQFRKLIELARLNGWAIGIGHPYTETVAVLAEELPLLPVKGVELVPVSELTNQGSSLWHAYSSPSPRDVKNWKPLPSPIF
jgi:polysaccharide deacetylase 2 family uncharacterized protein YibQ